MESMVGILRGVQGSLAKLETISGKYSKGLRTIINGNTAPHWLSESLVRTAPGPQ